MVNQYYNPRKRGVGTTSLEEHVRRFREHRMDWGRTDGECLATYFSLWRKAKEGGVTDFEASHRLLAKMPPYWKSWIRAQIRDILTYDPVTFTPIGDFPQLVGRVFLQWLREDGPPAIVEGRNRTPDPDEVLSEASEEIRELERIAAGETVTPAPLVRKCQNDNEAGPSGIKNQRSGMQVDTHKRLTPSIVEPRQELPRDQSEAQRESKQSSPEQVFFKTTARIKTSQPTRITIAALQSSSSSSSEMKRNSDNEQGNERNQEEESEPEEEETIDLTSD